MHFDVATQVMASYTQVDQEIAAFQAATQLRCPPGCGRCCQSPTVEATPLELLPLALELWQRGEAQAWLERITANDRGQCVFYQPDPIVPGNGRCQVYLWRPTVCRLFGFATTTDKTGTSHLVTCAHLKATAPQQVNQADAMVAAGGAEAPNFIRVAQEIAGLEPGVGHQRMPINQALRVAIEKVGLWFQISQTRAEQPA